MNSQNLLSNVFKPSYVYDSAGGYVPKLTISNVDSIVVKSVTVGDLAVGDSNSNVYIGINAGNPSDLYSLCNSSNMTAIGVGAAQGNKNSANSVFIGLDAGPGVGGTDVSGSISEVGIGYGTLGGGTSNIYIGPLTGSVGSNNIFIGPGILASGTTANELRIGSGSNIALYGKLSTGSVGINTTDITPGANFDVSAGTTIFRGKLGVQKIPTNSLDVLGRIYATDGILMGQGSATAPALQLDGFSNTGVFGYSNPINGRPTIGVGINGVERMTITDLSGLSVFGDLNIEGTFRAASTTLAPNTTLAAGGYIRAPDFTGSQLDLSAGGVYTLSNISVGGGNLVTLGPGFITDVSTNGYFRMMDDSRAIKTDVSGGNISYVGKLTGLTDTTSNRVGGITLSNTRIGVGTSAPKVALEVVGDVSATTYNGPGGTAGAPHYTFSDDRTTGVFFPGANMVGLTAGGVERMRISNNRIGIGISNPTNALDVSGVLRIVGASGDITFSNGSINVLGTPLVSATGEFSNSVTTSNSIGGVTLSYSNLSTVQNLDYSGAITGYNAYTYNYIGGVTLGYSNLSTVQNLDYSGAITGANTNAINSIGGVTLSSTNLSTVSNIGYSGAITGSTTNISNSIGGVTLCNNNLSTVDNIGYSGAITGSTANTSNSIGGVTLSNTNLSTVQNLEYSGTITGSTTNASNSIGGVTLSNYNLSTVQNLDYYGAITGNPYTYNYIGGVTLCNNNLSTVDNIGYSGAITGSTTNTSNSIGGVTLSNTNLSTVSNINLSGAITGSTTNASNSIGGVTLSNRFVAIGTNVPERTLDISSSQSPQVIIRNNRTSGDTEASIAVAGNGTTNHLNGLRMFQNGTDMGLYTSNSSTPFSIITNNARRLTILGNGNVGIGTSNPQTILDLATGTITLNQLGNIPNTTDVSAVVEGSMGVGMYWQKGSNNNNCGVSFRTLSNATLAERVRIDANTGRVGVGTTTPNYTLDVNGTFAANSNEQTAYVTATGANTVNVPTGFTKAHITLVGAGGGGGSSETNLYGGGGGGGAGWRLEQIITNPATMTVTIGTGGAGGSSSDGGNGTESTIAFSGLQSITMKAPGGLGGKRSTSGVGGAGGNGYYGGGGGGGTNTSNGGAAGTGTILAGSAGSNGIALGTGGAGGDGGGAGNLGQRVGGLGGGGGGGGPAGGAGASGGGAPSAGGAGCGGGGGQSPGGGVGGGGGTGGNGYAVIKFLR